MALLQKILRKLKNEQGSAAVISLLALMALLGFSAVVVDAGVLYVNKAELSNLADAAVLAGVQDLPGDIGAAQRNADSYAEVNGRPQDNVAIDVIDDKYIKIEAQRTVDLFFAKLFGYNSVDIRAQAAAGITPVSGVANIVPWGIEWNDFRYGDLYRLKEGGGSGYAGNYGALALGGRGAKIYEQNILEGYQGFIRIGDWLETEPGNISGKTKSGVAYRIAQDPSATIDTVKPGSARIVIVPVLESLEVKGRSDVKVVGFAAFFLEGCGGSGNKNYVEGRFLQLVVPKAETAASAGQYGTYGSALVPLSQLE